MGFTQEAVCLCPLFGHNRRIRGKTYRAILPVEIIGWIMGGILAEANATEGRTHVER